MGQKDRGEKKVIKKKIMNISTHKHTLNITKSPITLQKCGFNKKKEKKKTKIRELGYIHNEETLSTSMGQISNNAEQEKNPFYHKKRKKKKKKKDMVGFTFSSLHRVHL